MDGEIDGATLGYCEKVGASVGASSSLLSSQLLEDLLDLEECELDLQGVGFLDGSLVAPVGYCEMDGEMDGATLGYCEIVGAPLGF